MEVLEGFGGAPVELRSRGRVAAARGGLALGEPYRSALADGRATERALGSRVAASKREKSTWCAYSSWIAAQAKLPELTRPASSQMCPGVACVGMFGLTWIVTRVGTVFQSNVLASSAERT